FNKKHPPVGFMVGPITIWLIINTAVFIHLKGAAYFIIPTYFALVSFFILLLKKRSPVVVLTLLGAPAVFFFAPLVQFFPVGLGSDHVFISCIFTILLFGLLLPVLYNVKYKSLLAVACFVAAVVFFIDAHAKSGFSETRQKPNSLIYYKNADDQKAHWVTYDEILDDWTRTYLGETPENASNYVTNALGGKYGKDYTYAAAAPLKNIENFTCTLLHDSVNNTMRTVSFTVKPRKNANMIELFAAPSVTFSSLSFNGQVVPNDSTGKPFGGRKDTNLLRYILNRGDSLQVSFLTKIKDDIQFKVLEYSFDLTTHPQFNIKPRPKATMPKPFVVTDAIIVEKSFNLSEMKRAATDSVTPGRTVPRYPAFSDN
ncbi:MAG: peptidase M28, partial [Marinirhabdus sp.]